jgi:hypothetical protein
LVCPVAQLMCTHVNKPAWARICRTLVDIPGAVTWQAWQRVLKNKAKKHYHSGMWISEKRLWELLVANDRGMIRWNSHV